MPQPSTLMLIRNAAAFAAASPTLLFNDSKTAARLKRNESDSLHASGSGSAENGREKKCSDCQRVCQRVAANIANVSVFITAVPLIKLFAWGEGRVDDMCYERRRAEAGVD